MKWPTLLVGVCLALLPQADASAQGEAPAKAAGIELLKQPREFQNANVREALNRLSREARIVLEYQPEVIGTFSMKIEEPVTPFEAIKRVADQIHLFVEKKAPADDRAYTVWAKADFKPSVGAEAEPEKPTGEFWQSPAGIAAASVEMTAKMNEGISAYYAKPATAAKLARYYKNLYDALVKEGFSKEDALKIALSTSGPNAPADTTASKK